MAFASNPLKFDKPMIETTQSWHYDHEKQLSSKITIIKAQLNIMTAYVMDIVSFDKFGKIKPEEVLVPGAKPWFHLGCSNIYGATFEIVTDGDGWYPIDKKTKRISHRNHPARSVDYNNINALDKTVVEAAIDLYFKEKGP